MKFKHYTNMTFEVIGVTRHPRNQDKLTHSNFWPLEVFHLYSSWFWQVNVTINEAGIDVDSYRIGSYVHVE